MLFSNGIFTAGLGQDLSLKNDQGKQITGVENK